MEVAYFFSGFDHSRGFTDNIVTHLTIDIKRHDRLLLVAGTPSDHEKTDLYKDNYLNWFKQAGILFREFNVLDDRVEKGEALKWIHTASCIFLGGGMPLEQIGFLIKNGYQDAVSQSKAVIAGMSAGAINMAKTALCTKDEVHLQTVIYDGIGLADITVEPHFDPDNTELLEELQEISFQYPIFAMCDDSAIIVKNDVIEFMGDIYRIENGALQNVNRA